MASESCNIDKFIEQLMEGNLLTESELKFLCEKVKSFPLRL